MSEHSSPLTHAELVLFRFIQIMILHVAVREFIRGLDNRAVYMMVFSGVITVGMILSFWVKTKQVLIATMSIVSAMLLFKLITTFPGNSNHFYVELFTSLAILMVLSGPIDEKRKSIFRDYIMWLIVIVLAGSGIQKYLAGTYHNTAFMAYKVFSDPDFHDFYYMFDPAEARRIALQSTDEPFAFQNPFLRIMTISIPAVEILAGLLLLFNRTRVLGALVGIATLIGIEYVAKELMFGAIFCFMMCFQLPDRIFLRLIPLFIVIYILLTGLTLFVPSFIFN